MFSICKGCSGHDSLHSRRNSQVNPTEFRRFFHCLQSCTGVHRGDDKTGRRVDKGRQIECGLMPASGSWLLHSYESCKPICKCSLCIHYNELHYIEKGSAHLKLLPPRYLTIALSRTLASGTETGQNSKTKQHLSKHNLREKQSVWAYGSRGFCAS